MASLSPNLSWCVRSGSPCSTLIWQKTHLPKEEPRCLRNVPAGAHTLCATFMVAGQPLQQCCVLPCQFVESQWWHRDPQCFPRAKNIWRFASTLFFQGTVLYSLQKWHSVHKQRLERTRVKPAACAIAVREHYSVFNKWQSCSLPYPRLCEKGVV